MWIAGCTSIVPHSCWPWPEDNSGPQHDGPWWERRERKATRFSCVTHRRPRLQGMFATLFYNLRVAEVAFKLVTSRTPWSSLNCWSTIPESSSYSKLRYISYYFYFLTFVSILGLLWAVEAEFPVSRHDRPQFWWGSAGARFIAIGIQA